MKEKNIQHKIATIINFCSNETCFLKDCVEQAEQFSKNVFVVIADHFFNGEKEDLELLKKIFSSYSNCNFIVYPFFSEGIKSRFFQEKDKNHLWHSVSRYIGFCFVPKEVEYILFIDVDEIVEAKRFIEWLDSFSYKKYAAITLTNYWYFRSSSYRAKVYEDSPVFIRKKSLAKKMLLHKNERQALFSLCRGKKKRMEMGLDHLPMVHHYSWVRNKEQMLKKVHTWGHKNDCDWKRLVLQEFTSSFSGKDFIHGYDFEEVKPFVLLEEVKYRKKRRCSNAIWLSKKQFYTLIRKNFFNSLFC